MFIKTGKQLLASRDELPEEGEQPAQNEWSIYSDSHSETEAAHTQKKISEGKQSIRAEQDKIEVNQKIKPPMIK